MRLFNCSSNLQLSILTSERAKVILFVATANLSLCANIRGGEEVESRGHSGHRGYYHKPKKSHRKPKESVVNDGVRSERVGYGIEQSEAYFDPNISFEVKLVPELTLDDALDEVQQVYPNATLVPLFTLPHETLKRLSSVEEGLPDLTMWYRVFFPTPTVSRTNEQDEEEIVKSLNRMQSINVVETSKAVSSPWVKPNQRHHRLAALPDFVSNQGYLHMNSPSNNGIDAEYSWTFDGGDGEGVTIYDVEYSWNQQHGDLGVAHSVKLLLDEGDMAMDPFNETDHETNHGTAVLGEMVGTPNSFGVVGISPGAQLGLAPEYTVNLEFSGRSNAILLAVHDAKPGDIILLELQTPACGNPFPLDDSQDGYGPAEDSLSVFDVTKVATANGITIVAAAGNGNVNLDDPKCERKYDRAFRDSGAILVGAGGSGVGCLGDTAARSKLDFSTYGSRVDVQGWGSCIWTTGYGDGYNDTDASVDQNKWYTKSFSGTSGASPIVAGAAANIQGIAMKAFGAPLSPKELRQLLADTGTPQLGDPNTKIGPLVNLRRAIDSLLAHPPSNVPTCTPIKNIHTPHPTHAATEPIWGGGWNYDDDDSKWNSKNVWRSDWRYDDDDDGWNWSNAWRSVRKKRNKAHKVRGRWGKG